MNRHHDQGKSYKKHLIGTGLQGQRFSPLSSRWEHGSIHSGMAQAELRVLCLHPKAASGRLTSRQLGWGSYAHTHSDTPTSTRPHLQMVLLPGPRIYKPSHSHTAFTHTCSCKHSIHTHTHTHTHTYTILHSHTLAHTNTHYIHTQRFFLSCKGKKPSY